MSLPDDASLLSFYYISQSSQKMPYQNGIEGHQTAMTQPKEKPGTDFAVELVPGNTDYSIQGKENRYNWKSRTDYSAGGFEQ